VIRSLLVLISALVVVGGAQAREVVVRDDEGRRITFDVRASGVDVEWYAKLLRRAAHGPEISDVTFRIVPGREVGTRCGGRAGGCYRRSGSRAWIVVPDSADSVAAHTLMHEYGHHIDGAYDVPGVREPNGTPNWWAARGMERLLARGRIAFDYRNGWSRSAGEIFAEDYAQLHVPTPYRIDWLSPPGAAVRAALRRDLRGVPARPSLPPVEIVRKGTLGPGSSYALPFGLLGPGRRVTFTAQVDGAGEPGVRGRIELFCSGEEIAMELGQGQRSATIDGRKLGPGECSVELRSTSSASHRYTLRLRLVLESPPR